MNPEKASLDFEKLNDTLRGIVGALNARGFGDENPVLVEITTLKIEVRHLQATLKEVKTALWGIALSVIGLVIKIVMEGHFFK